MSRSIEDLSERMEPLVRQFVQILISEGVMFSVIETRRTREVQIAYYSQGRESLTEVNKKRLHAGLWSISEQDNTIITHTLNSRHMTGDAVDIVPLTSHGSVWWTAPKEVWERIGKIGESLGLEWGGRWGAKDGKLGWDCPHFQIK